MKSLPISYEMCDFLGVPRDTTMSRAEVTSHIYFYANHHNLIGKHRIYQDPALAKLLRLLPGEHVNLEYLQWYLRPHYSPPSFHQMRNESIRRTRERTDHIYNEFLKVFYDRCSTYFLEEATDAFIDSLDELDTYLTDPSQMD